MITIISGLPGAGKTSLMTYFLLQSMTGQFAKSSIKNANAVINTYIAGGMSYLSEQEGHLVYSDYPIRTKRGKVNSRYVNGYRIGLPNKLYDTHVIPPYSTIGLDEAQRYYNSRERGLADHVSRFYELHRQNNLTIYLASQRPGLIDKNIRELAQEVIFCISCSATFDYGFVTGFKWEILRYTNVDTLIRDIESGAYSHGVKDVVNFEGNLARHYDDKFFKHLFVDTEKKRDYSNLYVESYSYHIDAIKAFKRKYTFEVPDGYYKKRSV